MSLIKLRLRSFKFLNEANANSVLKKALQVSWINSINNKNKSAVQDLAFWGPKEGKILTQGFRMRRTYRLYFFLSNVITV